MKRGRGNREGSIFQRKDGRWTASIDLGQAGGRRQRRSFYAMTRSEVARKLTAALKAREDGLPIVGERQTLGQYLGQWLEAIRPTLRPESYRRYQDLCRLHIVPELGAMRLARLSPERVQAAYSHRLETGLSRTSVQLMHGVLHKALDQAMRWGLVPRNVSDLVTAPRRSTPEMRTLSPEEARVLLEAASGERLEALYVLAITCGLRLGELQALRWRDVDLDLLSLSVSQVLYKRGKVCIFKEPKIQ